MKFTARISQGSLLGPFLFLIYINDKPENAKNNNQIAMFADDISVVKAGKRKESQIQEDIDKTVVWFTSNILTVNASKCEVMKFRVAEQQYITIMKQKIPQKVSCNYLVFQIHDKMTFRGHIDHVVKKLNQFSGLIYKVRHLYSSKCLHPFYYSYGESVIRYGLLVYGSAAKTNLKKIEKAQRRILRAVFFKKKDDSHKKTIEKHKILTVFELYVLEVFNEVVQNLKHESPLDLLLKVDNPCTYATRRTKKRTAAL